MTFVYLSPESELTTERWQNMLGEAMNEVHCVTKWGSSSNNKIIQLFILYVHGMFVTLTILSVPFNAGRFTLSVWNFWP